MQVLRAGVLALVYKLCRKRDHVKLEWIKFGEIQLRLNTFGFPWSKDLGLITVYPHG